MSTDDEARYINYFRGALMCDGAHEFWGGYAEWFEKNRSRLAQEAQNLNIQNRESVEQLVDSIMLQPEEQIKKNVFSESIFQPLLTEALEICHDARTKPLLPVRLENSPAIDISPAALPSSVEHVIFIGQSTSSFCNYWSKIFSTAIAHTADLTERSPEAIFNRIKEQNILSDAVRLAVRHAVTGSSLGFGQVEQASELFGLRVLILNAMEIFILGHEIGHLVNHESHPETGGIPPGGTAIDLELSCDVFGLSVCSSYGFKNANPLAINLSGPLLFLYALHICEQTRKTLTKTSTPPSQTHPSTADRFALALQYIREVSDEGPAVSEALSIMEVALAIGAFVQMATVEIAEEISDG